VLPLLPLRRGQQFDFGGMKLTRYSDNALSVGFAEEIVPVSSPGCP
jgi:hypothetical protein